MAGELLKSREVAALLGVPLATFYRSMVKLREQGFPHPLLAGRYDPLAIERWRQRQAGIRIDGPETGKPVPAMEDADADGWADRLDERALQFGHADRAA